MTSEVKEMNVHQVLKQNINLSNFQTGIVCIVISFALFILGCFGNLTMMYQSKIYNVSELFLFAGIFSLTCKCLRIELKKKKSR
jgi:hypothetical protein